MTRSLESRSTGTLILGAEYQALGLVRQLHSASVTCALVDQDRFGAALFSRFRGPFHRSPRYDSDEFWPWLLELARRENYLGWSLIPTDDEQVRQIAINIEEARRFFRYAGPEWSDYQNIYDKRLSHEWCLKNGIPVPATFIPHSRADDPGESLGYPYIIKPAFKRNFSKHSKAKALRVEGPNDLARILAGPVSEVPVEDLLYQKIIRGDGQHQWSYAGFFVDGEPIAAYTACRRRQHPPDFGRASTFVIAEREHEVEAESIRVVRALRYTGLAEVEWKRDADSGVLNFLEVNARCWGWQSLSTMVVGNLPAMLHEFLLSSKLPTRVQPEYGWRWVKHVTDIPVIFDLLRRRDVTLSEYLRSLSGGKIVGCEWSRSDPLPFFLQFFLVPYLAIKRGY